MVKSAVYIEYDGGNSDHGHRRATAAGPFLLGRASGPKPKVASLHVRGSDCLEQVFFCNSKVFGSWFTWKIDQGWNDWSSHWLSLDFWALGPVAGSISRLPKRRACPWRLFVAVSPTQ